MIKIIDSTILELCNNEQTIDLGLKYLITKYKEKLYWQIKRIVEHHDDADEVLQNVWIKVWQNITKFKAESALSTWLYRIAYNESISFLQNKKKQKIVDWDVVSPTLEDTLHETELEISGMSKEEITNKINSAIDQLPTKQKLIFHLRYNDELPYSQISEITGTSEGALKASFHHAVKKIEEKFKKH